MPKIAKGQKAASLLIGACFEPKPEEAVIIRKKDGMSVKKGIFVLD